MISTGFVGILQLCSTTLYFCRRKGMLTTLKMWSESYGNKAGVLGQPWGSAAFTFPSSSWKSWRPPLVVCTLSVRECVCLNQKLTVLQHCWKGSCFSVVASCTHHLHLIRGALKQGEWVGFTEMQQRFSRLVLMCVSFLSSHVSGSGYVGYCKQRVHDLLLFDQNCLWMCKSLL